MTIDEDKQLFEDVVVDILEDILENVDDYKDMSSMRDTEKYQELVDIFVEEETPENLAEMEIDFEDFVEEHILPLDEEISEDTFDDLCEVLAESKLMTGAFKAARRYGLNHGKLNGLRRRHGYIRTANGYRKVSGRQRSAARRMSHFAHTGRANRQRAFNARKLKNNSFLRKSARGIKSFMYGLRNSEDDVVLIGFTFEDFDKLEKVVNDFDVDFITLDDSNMVLIAGKSKDLDKILSKLEIEGTWEDYEVSADEIEEACNEACSGKDCEDNNSDEDTEDDSEEDSEEDSEDNSEEDSEEDEEEACNEDEISEEELDQYIEEACKKFCEEDDPEKPEEDDSEKCSDKDCTDKECKGKDCDTEKDDEEDTEDDSEDNSEEDDSEDDSEEDSDDLDEDHMSAKERRMQKKNRIKREHRHEGEFSPKRITIQKKKDAGLVKIDKSRSRKAMKAAKYRRTYESVIPSSFVDKIVESAKFNSEAIVENIDAQFENSSFFGSLNESESTEMKSIISEAVSSILNSSYEKIAENVVDECDAYISESVIPEIIDIFDEKYIPEIVKSLNENIDGYITHIAESVVSDLSEKNLIVKSAKTLQLEEFSDELMKLISSKLQIIPEQEDALLSARDKIDELRERVEESSVERKKLVSRLNESKKEAYVYKNMPSSISESQKEKLLGYVDEVLCEAKSMTEFMEKFDKAVESINETASESTEKTVVEHVEEKKQNENSKTDLVSAIMSLGK